MTTSSPATFEADPELLSLAHAGYPLRPARGLDLLDGVSDLWVVAGHIVLLAGSDGPWEIRLYPEYRTVSGVDWFRYIRTCTRAAELSGTIDLTGRGVQMSDGLTDLATWLALYSYPATDEVDEAFADARTVTSQLGAGWAAADFSLLPVAVDLSRWSVRLDSPYGPVSFDGESELQPLEYGVDVIEFPGMAGQLDDAFADHIRRCPTTGVHGDAVFSVPTAPGRPGVRQALATVLRWPHRDLWEVVYDDPQAPAARSGYSPAWVKRTWGPDYSLPSMMRKGVLP